MRTSFLSILNVTSSSTSASAEELKLTLISLGTLVSGGSRRGARGKIFWGGWPPPSPNSPFPYIKVWIRYCWLILSIWIGRLNFQETLERIKKINYLWSHWGTGEQNQTYRQPYRGEKEPESLMLTQKAPSSSSGGYVRRSDLQRSLVLNQRKLVNGNFVWPKFISKNNVMHVSIIMLRRSRSFSEHENLARNGRAEDKQGMKGYVMFVLG